MKTIFEKEYDGESICDVERDILEVFNPEYNEEINDIPTDKNGFQLGTFKITITWKKSTVQNDKLYTIDELFSDKHEDGCFSDVLYEIYKVEYDRKKLREIFLTLPTDIQYVAYRFGLSDTYFCDKVFDYISEK